MGFDHAEPRRDRGTEVKMDETNGLVRAYGAHGGGTMNHMNHVKNGWSQRAQRDAKKKGAGWWRKLDGVAENAHTEARRDGGTEGEGKRISRGGAETRRGEGCSHKDRKECKES